MIQAISSCLKTAKSTSRLQGLNCAYYQKYGNKDRNKQTRKATPPKEVENDASARPPNLTWVSCDGVTLTRDFLAPKVDRFMPLPRRPLGSVGIKIG